MERLARSAVAAVALHVVALALLGAALRPGMRAVIEPGVARVPADEGLDAELSFVDVAAARPAPSSSSSPRSPLPTGHRTESVATRARAAAAPRARPVEPALVPSRVAAVDRAPSTPAPNEAGVASVPVETSFEGPLEAPDLDDDALGLGLARLGLGETIGDGRPSALVTSLVAETLDRPDAARTRPPRERQITGRETNEAVRSLVRAADRELGLGAPQETRVSHVVQEAGRASGVPSGTAFAVTITIDRHGAVTSASISGDAVGDAAWPHVLASVRELLANAPIPLGPDERSRGATVHVDAKVLHVLPSGGEHAVTTGECPKMPLVGGEAPQSFFAIGGTPYLEPPNGLCTLADGADIAAVRTIVVRTTTTTRRMGDAPPALSSFPKPKTKKLLPTPMELLLYALRGTKW